MKGLAVFGFLLIGMVLHAATPRSLRSEYNRAWQLTGEGRPDEAIPILKQIIAADPTFHPAYSTLIESYWEKNELDMVGEYFRSLVTQSPGNGLAYYGLGELHRIKNQHEVAAAYYSKCISQNGEAYACYFSLVDELMAGHNNTLSLVGLKKWIPLDPRSPYSLLAQARMHHLQFKLPEAIQASQRGLDLARSLGNAELIAVFYRQLAKAYGAYDGQHQKCIEYLQESLRIYRELDDREMQLELTREVGGVYLQKGEPAQALALLEQNLFLARELRHHLWKANAQISLGIYSAFFGDHRAALQFFHQAEMECEASRVSPPLSPVNTILPLIGAIYEAQGDLANARASFEKHHEWAVHAGAKWDEAFSLRRLGDIYRDSGEYFKALESLMEAVRLFRQMGRRDNAGAGLRVIGSVHSVLGNYSIAADYYRQSLLDAREVHDAEQQERIHLGLGELYLRTRQPRNALTHLQKALSLAENTPQTNLKPRALLDKGEAYGMLGNVRLALTSLNDSLQIARQIHNKPDEAQALIALGHLELTAGNLRGAESRFRESLDLAGPVGLAEATVAARRGLGETCARMEEFTNSLRHLQLAVETIESMRGHIPTPELKSSFVQENWKTYEDIVYVLSRLNDKDATGGYDRQAFYYAERSRARSFLDLLAESKASITKSLTSAQQQQQASLFADLSKASATTLRAPRQAGRRFGRLRRL